MYKSLLTVHSLLRYALLLLLIAVVVRAFAGWLGKKSLAPVDRKLPLALMIAADLQLLLGILLYAVFSPQTKLAFADFGAAMKSRTLRFLAVEHGATALIAIVLIHVGYSAIKKSSAAGSGFKKLALACVIALLLLLFAVPWPFRAEIGRPWLPF